VDVTLDGSNTAVIRKLAQSGEQWQSPVTTLMLSRMQWSTCVVTTHSVSVTEVASGGVAMTTTLHSTRTAGA